MCSCEGRNYADAVKPNHKTRKAITMCKSQFFILPNLPENLKPHCFFDGEICDQDFGFCKNCSRKQTLPAKKVEWEKETWDGEHYITYPVCPTCGEMVGGTECDGCGQKFLMTDDLQEYLKPPQPIQFDCLICGGKNTVIGTKNNHNSHVHGICEKCGAEIWID